MIVVTGGTRGIGKAIVQKFAAQGFDVVTCSRNEDELKALHHDIESRFNTRLYYTKADLSDRKQVGAFVDFINQSGKPVKVLVNNTGIYVPGQVHNEDEGVLEKLIETNLYSAYHLTRGVIGGMVERKNGHIFNICSVASIMPYPNGGSYSISKYALYGMTKVLREEMKPHNVRVTAVLPGATLTESWAGVNLPPSRFMKPEDVADAIFTAYSLSPNSVIEELLIRPQLGDIV